ncbi:ABC transporter ATP-binding protein [Umezawaea tangerina]|uniref:ABC-2 type transport system ATP-binding protein n=1 Tax=Umezawaea tangerina TaxID=84725 RepID=A0A2T0T763_9PSEU|nr:ATP-binding cassette domain-containing protein [Umezawaea tangerina]PRY41472.1 ABC-2 type transport system ATP-binding protein [Umezawaea tangerina]
MTDDAVVRATGLGKDYGARTAVDGVDLEVAPGQVFGFLGPNGAGKSTTIGMLCTVIRPTRGRAEVAGHDVLRSPDEVRQNIGLLFQESTLDADLTAVENLRFQAELYGLPRRHARTRIDTMLDLVDLADRRDDPVRLFSGGMCRRLEIARGLLHTPKVLFLDEPTTGLDAQTRVAIWEHLHRMREEAGLTVFLTTHHLSEAENCDRIAIIDRGGVVAEGPPAALKAVVGTDLVTLRTGDDQAALRAVRTRFGLDGDVGAEGLRIRAANGAHLVPRLCAELTVPVHSVVVTEPTLDEVFLHHTGRTIREPGPRTAGPAVGSRS